MKRPITKLFSIVLSLASLLGMSAVPVMAENTYYNTLNENSTWTFTESTTITDYVRIMDRSSDVTSNTGVSIVKDADTDNDVLKIENQSKFRASAYDLWTCMDFGKTVAPHMGFKFSFMRPEGDDTAQFNVALRQTSADKNRYSVLYMKNKELYFFGTKVIGYTYEPGYWYDVEMEYDLTQGYGRLSIKKQGEQKAFVTDVMFAKLYTTSLDEAKAITTDLTSIGFSWGQSGSSASAAPYGTVYIDNVCQYDFDETKLTPTLNAISDNTSLWKLENNSGDYSSLTVDDGAVTVTENDSTSHRYPQLAIAPFHNGYDVRHRIRFDITSSYFDEKASMEFAVRFADPSSTVAGADSVVEINEKTDFTVATLKGTSLNLVGGSTISIDAQSNKPYACDFVYDAKNKVALMTVTAPDGTVYQADTAVNFNNYVFTDDTEWKNLLSIRINCVSGVTETWTMTLDNFKWDVLSRSAVNASASVKAADSGAASMDETVIIDYGRPVNNAATLGDAVEGGGATVSVTAGGEAVSEGSALTTQDGKVFVKFSDLEPSTTYTVTVSGVTLLESGLTVPNATATFTTWETDLAASAPSVTDNVISANVISGYADGTDVILIAALYQGGELSKVLTNPAIAKSRDGEEITLSLAGETYDSVQIFVWDSFEAMRPLTAMVPYPNN